MYNMIRKLLEGVYLNIVVIVTYFVANVMRSLFINEFIRAQLL